MNGGIFQRMIIDVTTAGQGVGVDLTSLSMVLFLLLMMLSKA